MSMTQTIAIIGAGPGISRAVAHQFGREGYRVVLIGRTESKLNELVTELRHAGVSATAVVADASDAGQLTTALQSIDGLSVLHYNASVSSQIHVLDETETNLMRDFSVNVVGLLTAVKAALPQLETHTGSVLVTGGGLAKYPHPDYASLSVGKAGEANLARSLAQVLAPKGIYVGVLQVNGFVNETDPVYNPASIAGQFWTMHTNKTLLENEI